MIVVSGPWSDRVGRRKPFVIASSLGMCVAPAMPFVFHSEASMFAYSIVSGCAFGMYMAVDTASDDAGTAQARRCGQGHGVLNVANALPQALAPAVAAAVIAVLGGYSALFVVGVVLVAFGALSILPHPNGALSTRRGSPPDNRGLPRREMTTESSALPLRSPLHSVLHGHRVLAGFPCKSRKRASWA
ncbi:MFS transporter [Streptomyces sp. KL116D]|uniref:MFS transporter n=1 Tax=Streptomyces sp. KL116D TaxID=3045152 RepID=UPI003558742D